MNSLLRFECALGLQLLLLFYHLATTLIDFFPFNGVRFMSRKEKWVEVSTNDVLMALPPIGFFFHIHGLMVFGAIYYVFLYFGELGTWGIPYFLGAKAKWKAYHERVYAQTITVLPRRGDHPTPNLEHMILNLLTLLAASSTLLTFAR